MAVAKVERLLVLMNTLLGAPRPLTSAEIRSRVVGYPDEDASFRRAFERDKDEIRDMGVPLLVEPVPGTDPPATGYRIRVADYTLADPGLEPDELEALHLAAAVVGPAGGLGQQALFKLGGSVARDADRTEIPASPDLIAAFTGVAERRRVTFRYREADRVVHPYRLEFQRGRWYLNGFDELRAEDRWYRMSRIEGTLEVIGAAGAFERPETAVPGLRVEPWQLGGASDPVEAEVWFDPAVAGAVRAEVGAGVICSDDDDGLVVRLPVTNRAGFRSWLLTFLERAEVLGPPDLRTELIGWLDTVAAGGEGGAVSRARITAAERIQRLLAMLQWAATHQGGVPIAELCARFGFTPGDLVKELEMASMIGADTPHYDEMPFEAFVEDGRVYVRLFSFDRPLRLTPGEGLALVVAADALVDPDEPETPLARALDKVGAVLGIEPGSALDVDLDPEGGTSGRLLRAAIDAGLRVRFRYWTYGRDAVADREVSPWQVFNDQGAWYLAGLAHDRDAERRFRVDRMEHVESTTDPATPAPPGLEMGVALPEDGPRVVLDLAPDARWVAEAYPVIDASELAGGRLRVTLVVSGPSWLERLVLRLGGAARIVSIDPVLGGPDMVAVVARRVRDRYRESSDEVPRASVDAVTDPRDDPSPEHLAGLDRRVQRDEDVQEAALGSVAVDAGDPPPTLPPKSAARNGLEWVAVIFGAVLIAVVIRTTVLQTFWIPSPSMASTLVVDDRVLVNKLSYKFHDINRGDVVVFERPANEPASEIKDLIKRVVALPGDRISITEGEVHINGRVLDEPYVNDLESVYSVCGAGEVAGIDTEAGLEIPEGHVFVMGDNRTNSHDSRCFGPIDEDLVVGRAFAIIWPPSKVGGL